MRERSATHELVKAGRLSNGHKEALKRIVAWFEPTARNVYEWPDGCQKTEPATLHFVPQEPGTSHAHIEAAAAAMDRLTRFLAATGSDRAKAESWVAG